jgi:hypothetical protein
MRKFIFNVHLYLALTAAAFVVLMGLTGSIMAFEFPEVKGKTIVALKLYLEDDDTSISLAFDDKTHLYFDLEPGLTVRADLSDWKTHNWHPIKSWPPLHRRSSWVEEPANAD